MNLAVAEAANTLILEEYEKQIEAKKPILRFPEDLFPKTGFLDEWIKYTDPITEAPLEYLLISGLMLLSSVVQDKYYFIEAEQKLKLNIYVILCGVSSETRKTTSINLTKRFIQKYFDDSYLFPSRTNPEALLSLMAGKIPSGEKKENGEPIFLEPQTRGLITYSEFAEFTSHSNKEYARGLKELLTSAFDDCPPEDILTKKEGRLKPVIDFVNFFAASTPEWISSNLKEYELWSGFLARFLMVYAEPSGKCIPFRLRADEELEMILSDFLKRLAIAKPAEIIFTDDSREIYEEWYRKDKDRAKHDKSETAAFFSRHRDYAKKLAALFQIAENEKGLIEPHNVTLAIKMINALRFQLKYLVNEKLFVDKNIGFQMKLQDIIGRHPGISKSDLLRETRKDSELVNKNLQALIDQELIEGRKEKTGGRDVERYWALL